MTWIWMLIDWYDLAFISPRIVYAGVLGEKIFGETLQWSEVLSHFCPWARKKKI